MNRARAMGFMAGLCKAAQQTHTAEMYLVEILAALSFREIIVSTAN